jgi:hypothetical protein
VFCQLVPLFGLIFTAALAQEEQVNVRAVVEFSAAQLSHRYYYEAGWRDIKLARDDFKRSLDYAVGQVRELSGDGPSSISPARSAAPIRSISLLLVCCHQRGRESPFSPVSHGSDAFRASARSQPAGFICARPLC